LRGDDATTRPLVATIASRKGDGADDAITIDERSPHLETEATVDALAELLGCRERRLQLFPRGEDLTSCA
jgi:hypothetical protein